MPVAYRSTSATLLLASLALTACHRQPTPVTQPRSPAHPSQINGRPSLTLKRAATSNSTLPRSRFRSIIVEEPDYYAPI
jgi:hypothetical protein